VLGLQCIVGIDCCPTSSPPPSPTPGDLLNNYCSFDPVANAARFFFALVIMLTYPIECFVAREVS